MISTRLGSTVAVRSQPTSFAFGSMMGCLGGPMFACPGTSKAINLYELAYEAARRTAAAEAQRRHVAICN